MRVLSLLHIRIIYSIAIHRVAVLCIKKLDRDHTRVIYILDIRNIESNQAKPRNALLSFTTFALAEI